MGPEIRRYVILFVFLIAIAALLFMVYEFFFGKPEAANGAALGLAAAAAAAARQSIRQTVVGYFQELVQETSANEALRVDAEAKLEARAKAIEEMTLEEKVALANETPEDAPPPPDKAA